MGLEFYSPETRKWGQVTLACGEVDVELGVVCWDVTLIWSLCGEGDCLSMQHAESLQLH